MIQQDHFQDVHQFTVTKPETSTDEAEGKLIVPEAQGFRVTNQDEYEAALSFMRRCKEKIKYFETKFEKAIKTAFDLHRSMTKLRGDLSMPYNNAYSIVEREASRWFQEQRRIAAAAEEAARREAKEKAEAERRERERKLEEERLQTAQDFIDAGHHAEADKILEAPVYVPPAASVIADVLPIELAPKKVKGATVRQKWIHRVTDKTLLPEEYKMADDRKIAKVVAALGPEAKIPGIEILEDMKVSVRKIGAEQADL